MPRLWSETIETHRGAVRQAVLDAAAELVVSEGLRGVTMSQIAERAGIGRATLYKYFPDVEAILSAWHERQVGEHLRQLGELVHAGGDPLDRVRAALDVYASAQRKHHSTQLAAVLEANEHVARAQAHLQALVEALIREGVDAGVVRADTPAGELASYCLHAASAARSLRSRAAVSRLLDVVVSGLRA